MKQRGQAFLAFVMLLVVAVAMVLFAFLPESSGTIRDNRRAAQIMTAAKAALIGHAASSSVRPGRLPCPDTNNDGVAEPGDANGCPSGNIGRLPWKTLGIEEPTDGAGERLWYAVSPYFGSDPTGCPPVTVPASPYPSPCILNSDTKGTLTVYQDSTATVDTSEAVAVLFAPGAALGAQNRDTVATALCPTTGTTIARNLCAANYLETAAGVNNATTNGPFISALNSDTFNDKVMAITTASLMPVVEQRVAREVLTLLKNYKTATGALGYNAGAGAYPWSDCADGSSDGTENRNRIPWRTAVSPVGGYTLPVDWGTSGVPALPAWYVNNYWSWVIYYSVGKNYLEGNGATCTSCVNPTDLTVTGVGSKELIIIMTGPAGASRPLGPPATSGMCDPLTVWTAYLEDSENNDGSNDTYVMPSSTAYARDRLYACPGTPGICP